MKTALDYIFESGCRNIDSAVEGVIDRLAPDLLPLPERISPDGHIDILLNKFKGDGTAYEEWVNSFYINSGATNEQSNTDNGDN